MAAGVTADILSWACSSYLKSKSLQHEFQLEVAFVNSDHHPKTSQNLPSFIHFDAFFWD